MTQNKTLKYESLCVRVFNADLRGYCLSLEREEALCMPTEIVDRALRGLTILLLFLCCCGYLLYGYWLAKSKILVIEMLRRSLFCKTSLDS